jgi:hypothetical protein
MSGLLIPASYYMRLTCSESCLLIGVVVDDVGFLLVDDRLVGDRSCDELGGDGKVLLGFFFFLSAAAASLGRTSPFDWQAAIIVTKRLPKACQNKTSQDLFWRQDEWNGDGL